MHCIKSCINSKWDFGFTKRKHHTEGQIIKAEEKSVKIVRLIRCSSLLGCILGLFPHVNKILFFDKNYPSNTDIIVLKQPLFCSQQNECAANSSSETL